MNRRNYFAFLVSQGFFPFCVVLGSLTGQEFMLHSDAFYLAAVSAVSVWLAYRIRTGGEQSRLGMPALVLSLVHGLTMLIVLRWWASGVAAVVVIVCGWVVFEAAPKGVLKILCHVFSLLLTLLLLLITPIWFFVSAMVHEEVVQQLDSPGGRYTAMVISSNQGALGGDTLVEVRDNQKTVNILIGSFVDSRLVYHGEWYEWEDMELDWQDEGILSINGKSSSVKKDM